MTWTEIAEHWDLLGGQAQSKWPKLSDVDLAAVGGDRDRLITMLEKRYGLPANDGEQHVDEWLDYDVLALPSEASGALVVLADRDAPYKQVFGRAKRLVTVL